MTTDQCRNCGQPIRLTFTDPDTGAQIWDHPTNGNHTVCDWVDGMAPTDRVATPAGRHVITARADGPDLDDLVAVLRYLREHGNRRTTNPSPSGIRSGADHALMEVRWTHPTGGFWTIREGDPEDEAFYVGPDGAVYDANGEAL